MQTSSGSPYRHGRLGVMEGVPTVRPTSEDAEGLVRSRPLSEGNASSTLIEAG